MKLSTKNLIYTTVITIILAVFILGYIIFMLPSLYVDYMMEDDLFTVKKMQMDYLKTGKYDEAGRSTVLFTIDMDLKKEPVVLTCPAFQVELAMKSPKMKSIMAQMKEALESEFKQMSDNGERKEKDQEDFNRRLNGWLKEIKDEMKLDDALPIQITPIWTKSLDQYQKEGNTKMHMYGEDILVLSDMVYDGSNHYSSHRALTYKENRIVVTYYGTMTPKMSELAPVVMNSLPMLLAAIILFAMIVSFLYSKGMIDPILRLVRHTKMIEGSGRLSNAQLEVTGQDEIAELTQTLNQLYRELDLNMKDLEQKNVLLEEKNQSQEVFLRASSHQLKTPIAAALLLVDGMIHEIGKYKDTKTYLPQVKQQLLSMRKMVEDILYLNHCEEQLEMKEVDLNQLLREQLACHQVALQEGEFQVETRFTSQCVRYTDCNLMEKIIDNLLSNAIHYSQPGSILRIQSTEDTITIFNGGAHIREEILPEIFEPFVSESGKGHGLGLYIVKYYTKLLGIEVHIQNEKNGVMTKILF